MKSNSFFTARTLVTIAMLGAIAAVLMFLEVPLPFLAPTFYKMDLSEVPVLIGGFALGPVAGILIEFLKILLHLLFKGTQTAFVGELGNFLIGVALMLPAALVYRKMRTRKGALVGMIIGTICIAIAGAAVNAALLLPAYGKAFHMDTSAFVAMGTAINPAINSLFRFCLLAVAPFNLIKGAITAAVTFLLYKRVRPLIHS